MAITDRLRAAADWLDTTDLPDDVHVIIGQDVRISLFAGSNESARTVRRLVGKVDKRPVGGGMTLDGAVSVAGFDDMLNVTIWPPSDTCKQVQTGTQIVTREEPVETRTVTETVPVFEWDCGLILADEPEDAVA